MNNRHALFTHWRIFEGPRAKRLATEHLELIVYGLLASLYSHKEKLEAIQIGSYQFAMDKILKACPDFEQIRLHRVQLDVYQSVYTEFGNYKDPLLHDCEINAIRLWTGNAYSAFNEILRQQKTSGKYYSLLNICLATHALGKLPPAKKMMVHYRWEDCFNLPFLQERMNQAKVQQLTLNQGFTASSAGLIKNGPYKTIFSEHTTNSIGKDITKYSSITDELEYLFPPNTEFAYGNGPREWTAQAFRSVNNEHSYAYAHSFSETDLRKISLEKESIRLATLAKFLKLTCQSLFQPVFILQIECVNCLSNQSIVEVKEIISKLTSTYSKASITEAQNLNHALDFAQEILEKLQQVYPEKTLSTGDLNTIRRRTNNKRPNAEPEKIEVPQPKKSKLKK